MTTVTTSCWPADTSVPVLDWEYAAALAGVVLVTVNPALRPAEELRAYCRERLAPCKTPCTGCSRTPSH